MTKIVTLTATAIISGSAFAGTTSLQLSDPDRYFATGFANSGASDGTNGLFWGIVVDVNGDGFDSGAWTSGFSFTADQSATSLSTASGLSDDILYMAIVSGGTVSQLPTFDTTGATETGAGAGVGGNGTILAMDGLDDTLFSTGDSFGLIWLDSNDVASAGSIESGDHYGFYTNAAFTLQEGNTVFYDQVFAGTDPIRTANLQFVSAVPEPSSTALLGLGSVALLLRRRR